MRRSEAPAASPAVRVAVASQADLLAARAAYLERAAAGFTGRLELHFTASLPATSWSLEPAPGGPVPAFELVLRGDGAVLPAPGRLVARAVHLQGLVLTGPVAESSRLEVEREASLRDCAVIDGRGTAGAATAPYLQVLARGAAPAALGVERTWFVRNWQASESRRGAALFGTRGDARCGGHFRTVRFSDSVFLGNAFEAELSLAAALDVTFERGLLAKTWPSGVLLDAAQAAAVTVVDSIVVVDDLARVARLGRDVPPIAVRHSRLYAASYRAATVVPAALALTRSIVTRSIVTRSIVSRSIVAAQGPPPPGGAAGAAEALEAAARLPVALPPTDLRQQLMQALQP